MYDHIETLAPAWYWYCMDILWYWLK